MWEIESSKSTSRGHTRQRRQLAEGVEPPYTEYFVKEIAMNLSSGNKREGCFSEETNSSQTSKKKEWEGAKHTAAGIPTWSPTVVLICRSTAYVWQSGRDAQFSADCG
ncbi:hypothetical protein KCU85_g9612, partial [Aureobasidium melanogenum]